MPPPKNLPSPVIFGPSFPDITMVTQHGRQRFRSRTNQNLYLNEYDFTDRGTFTMARLLRLTAKFQECWQLIWDQLYGSPEGEVEDWNDFLAEPDWYASEAFTRLLGYSQSEREQHFFLEWCRAQYKRNLGQVWGRWSAGMQRRERPWELDWRFKSIAFDLIDLVFDFPALIPETWLNYVGPDKTAADERHLAENPSRVDFVVFATGRKYVIEIDGPSHYADFDEATRTYRINEEKYAKNLAIERSLRRQGWEIYRFANVEVMRASGDDFVTLLKSAQVPGVIWTDDLFVPFDAPLYPEVEESALAATLDLYIKDMPA